MDYVYYLVQQALPSIAALLVVALGGMFAERSGVINIALEGIMLVGAFIGCLFVKVLNEASVITEGNAQWVLVLCTLIAGVAGAVYSLLLSFSAVTMKADQTIAGTAMNIMVPAFILFISRMIWGVAGIENSVSFFMQKVPVLGDIPVIGPMFFQKTYITFYLSIVIVVISSVFYSKTKLGLRIRSCGEHPHAADSVGINVYKMRYIGTTISGVLGGMGGFFYAVGIMSTKVDGNTGVAGMGFLALAVMIFGQWKPLWIFLAAIFFGIVRIFPYTFQLPESMQAWKVLLQISPYVMTMVVLAFTSKRSRAPKAEGIPYDKGLR